MKLNIVEFTAVENKYAVRTSFGVLLGELYREDDGFYTFSPNREGGNWDAYVLLTISDKLNELNKPWAKRLKKAYEIAEAKDKLVGGSDDFNFLQE